MAQTDFYQVTYANLFHRTINGIHTKVNNAVTNGMQKSTINDTVQGEGTCCKDGDDYISPHCIKHQAQLDTCDVIR